MQEFTTFCVIRCTCLPGVHLTILNVMWDYRVTFLEEYMNTSKLLQWDFCFNMLSWMWHYLSNVTFFQAKGVNVLSYKGAAGYNFFQWFQDDFCQMKLLLLCVAFFLIASILNLWFPHVLKASEVCYCMPCRYLSLIMSVSHYFLIGSWTPRSVVTEFKWKLWWPEFATSWFKKSTSKPWL